ncbi:hypothetical protein B0T10DRAFT_82638 [Thelonectria olida]|uniref:DUF7704 domain-containing protein n=1 Tax=Thelonectria olida TaxID=1576542 RepID=A0A9P8VMM6_9HYPO|nr:hypothetical protein B0T10DRAFT_82638 [Thelonectria olida]
MMNQPALNVPFAYRALFLYFEPIGAFVGALLLLFRPASFLNVMAPAANYATDNQIIYDQLAATYILFAFNEAIILRTTNDLRVWRRILIGILMCDAIHLYGSWAALGGTVFWDPHNWRPEDWVNLVSLWGQAAVRLAFVAGVGLKPVVTAKRG